MLHKELIPFFSKFVNNSSNKNTNISKHYIDNLPIQNSVFTFETVTQSIILNAINNLKHSNSCGFDLISTKISTKNGETSETSHNKTYTSFD